MLTVAGIINAVGVTLFLTPLNLIDGGFSGTSFILSAITPDYLPLSFWLIVLNFPFYLFARKKLGNNFIIYSLYAVTIYSLFALVLQMFCGIDFSNGSPIVANDRLLASIFGGLLSGIGSGLVIRFSGALDGVEVLAVLFAKKLNLSVGSFVMCYNVVLFLCAVPVFGSSLAQGLTSWVLPLYSIIAYAVAVKAVNFVVEGLDAGIGALIVTDNPDGIASELTKELGRGVTILDGKGYYSNAQKKVIYVVINRFETATLRKIVKSSDTKAFVSFFEVNETLGAESNVKFKPRIKKTTKVLHVDKHSEKLYQKTSKVQEVVENTAVESQQPTQQENK